MRRINAVIDPTGGKTTVTLEAQGFPGTTCDEVTLPMAQNVGAVRRHERRVDSRNAAQASVFRYVRQR